MAESVDLAFRLTANASGMNAGVAQAERSLRKVEGAAKATSKEFRDAARITAQVRTPAEKYAATVEKLDNLMAKGLLTQETYSRAVSKADADMRKAESSTNNAAESVDRLAASAENVASGVSNVELIAGKMVEAAKHAAAWGASLASAYAQWQFWSAIKSPAAFAEFAMNGVKVVATARNAITGLKLLGVSFAVAGGSAGVLSTAALALTNPMLGLTLAAINVTRQFFASRDAAYETARGIAELRLQAAMTGETFQNLNLQKALDAGVARADLIAMGGAIAALDVGHFNDLALAMDESEKAAKRLEVAESAVTRTIGSAFTGLLEGISGGLAGLRNGLAELTAGANTLLAPIAQAFRPVGTLLGTVIEAGGRLLGVFGSLAGSVLRVAGLATSVLLSPFIVGLNNLADAIKNGVGSAFDWVSKKIASFNSLIDKAYNYLSKLPVIGGVFASNEGGVAAAAAGGAAAADAAAESVPMAAEESDNFANAIRSQEQALSSAIDKAMQYGDVGAAAAIQYQETLRGLQGELEAGILNETSYAQAAERARRAFDDQITAIEARAEAAKSLAAEDAAAEQANAKAASRATDAYLEATKSAQQFGAAGAAAAAEYEGGLTALNERLADGRINAATYADEAEKLRDKFKGATEQMKALAAAQKKRDDDVARMEERIDDARGFQREARATLGREAGEALQVADVRSAEGIATFMQLASGREDPAIAEYRKSNETLKAMLNELRALQMAPLEIAGGAGG